MKMTNAATSKNFASEGSTALSIWRAVFCGLVVLLGAIPLGAHANGVYPSRVDGPDEAAIAPAMVWMWGNHCGSHATCVWTRYEVTNPYLHPDAGQCTISGAGGAGGDASPYTCIYITKTLNFPYCSPTECGVPKVVAAAIFYYLHSCAAPATYGGLWR